MAGTTGIQGLLSVPDTSGGSVDQTGFFLHHLLNSGVGPYSASYSETADNGDVTQFASTVPVTGSVATGVKSWTLNFSARFQQSFGKCGNVTFANGYVLGVNQWSMGLNWAEYDDTEFGSTCPEYASYGIGLMTGTCSWAGRIDDTTAVAGTGDSGGATFRLTDETTVDNTLACNIKTIQEDSSVAVGQKNTVGYSALINGNVTAAGDSPIFPSGAMVKPETTEIVLRAAGSRTYTGLVVPTALNITVPVRGLIDVTGTLRGSGALTRA